MTIEDSAGNPIQVEVMTFQLFCMAKRDVPY